MILAFLVLPILVTANPFHKYPYVFLLDVGNEELEKVNTEQIRLSSPGGSVALRHPAIGNGDDIAHVRVSGIDFGTELKANIVDGGPGYKYVVIVLMGNPGVAFDAVITIQTVPSVVNEDKIQNIEDNSNSSDNDVPNTYEASEEDLNNSAEDFNDSAESEESSQNGVNVRNAELRQESSNVYRYVQDEAVSGYGSEYNDESHDGDEDSENNDESDNIIELTDINKSNNEDSESKENVEIEDYAANEDDTINQRSAERYSSNDDYIQSNEPIIVDQNLYNKYKALQDHFNGAEVYSQESIQAESNGYNDDQSYYSPVDISDVYDDYEESDPGKYRDANNNFIDTDDSSAVAY